MTILLKKKIKSWALTLALGGSLMAGVPALERATAPIELSSIAAAGQMSLSVFDVGQGDSILAQEGDKQILIDGGPDSTVLERLGNTMPAGDREIDLVILTHPHSDHVNGLAQVLSRYKVDKILATDVTAPIVSFRTWRELIAKDKIPVDDPQKVKTEKVGDMEYDVLSAGMQAGIRGSEHDGNSDGLNDSSIVGMLKFGSRRFLLMGDATTVIENKLMSAGDELKADFLKVGHHGSTYSTSEKFIDAVSPAFAATSVGAKNPYGNPAWRVMQLVKNKAITGYRTDENGTVTALTDGSSLQVAAERVK
jgi:competence protein ComEC